MIRKEIILVILVLFFIFVSNASYANESYSNELIEFGTYIKNEDGIVIEHTLYNDIDSLVFMVNELEALAYEFNPSGNIDDINNLTLAFIRSINNAYYNGYIGMWQITAGDLDLDFVSYVNVNDNASIKIKEYFANFVSNEDFLNTAVFGNFDSDKYELNQFLIDPINEEYIEFNKIDIIHMIASIDGTYINTDCPDLSVGHDFQRDLVGWAGDLQQHTHFDLYHGGFSAYDLSDFIDQSDGSRKTIIDFQEYNDLFNNHFSNPDILADVDGMNIARIYLDQGKILSEGLYLYYELTSDDNSFGVNRYKKFIGSVAEDSEYVGYQTEEIFYREILLSMGIYVNYNGDYNSISDLGTHPMYYILRGKTFNYLDVPPENLRIFAAEFFYDYIIYMSTPSEIGGGGYDPGDPKPGPGFWLENNNILLNLDLES